MAGIYLLGTQLARRVVVKDREYSARAISWSRTEADRYTEVERAIENLVKSGKMFGAPGGRREFLPPFLPGPARFYSGLGKYA